MSDAARSTPVAVETTLTAPRRLQSLVELQALLHRHHLVPLTPNKVQWTQTPATPAPTINQMRARAEFTVEPFVDGKPGAHVRAAIDAVRSTGLEPQIGPFATVVDGEATAVISAMSTMLDAAQAAGIAAVLPYSTPP